jgi:hypothetical protein
MRKFLRKINGEYTYPDATIPIPAFSGAFALNNTVGTYWPAIAQSGAMVLTIGSEAEVGAFERVKITADGSGITLSGAVTWINVAGAIDDSLGAVNIIEVRKVSATEIEYRVMN